MYPTGYNIVKTVYELLNNLCKSSILERDMMSIFPNCVKNVRIQAINDVVKFSRRLMQKILDLLGFDLTTSKDQSYPAESE